MSHCLYLGIVILGTDLEASLLSFEKLDRASPDLWPEQLPGVAEFAASFKSPITSSPPKWMAELENDDIDMLKELGSLTTANLMEKVRGLQNLAYQLGLDESPLPVNGQRRLKEIRHKDFNYLIFLKW
uniref:Protein lin-52 homolog n=1 Tax=Monodelphis domestica TaxID=13616 RepID=F7FRQ5_MONDO